MTPSMKPISISRSRRCVGVSFFFALLGIKTLKFCEKARRKVKFAAKFLPLSRSRALTFRDFSIEQKWLGIKCRASPADKELVMKNFIRGVVLTAIFAWPAVE